jgi:hypothetical protein
VGQRGDSGGTAGGQRGDSGWIGAPAKTLNYRSASAFLNSNYSIAERLYRLEWREPSLRAPPPLPEKGDNPRRKQLRGVARSRGWRESSRSAAKGELGWRGGGAGVARGRREGESGEPGRPLEKLAPRNWPDKCSWWTCVSACVALLVIRGFSVARPRRGGTGRGGGRERKKEARRSGPADKRPYRCVR